MVDPGEGPEARALPLFLDQTAARRAEKNFETAPTPHVRVWMTGPSRRKQSRVILLFAKKIFIFCPFNRLMADLFCRGDGTPVYGETLA